MASRSAQRQIAGRSSQRGGRNFSRAMFTWNAPEAGSRTCPAAGAGSCGETGTMNTESVEAYLRSRAGVIAAELTIELGRRGDAAYLRLTSVERPDRWAVVVSPGSRWFAVEVANGYSLDHFDEDLDDHEVRAILDDYLEVATAYVRGGATMTRIGRLRFPALIVSTPTGDRTLRRSVLADLKGALRLGDRS